MLSRNHPDSEVPQLREFLQRVGRTTIYQELLHCLFRSGEGVWPHGRRANLHGAADPVPPGAADRRVALPGKSGPGLQHGGDETLGVELRVGGPGGVRCEGVSAVDENRGWEGDEGGDV